MPEAAKAETDRTNKEDFKAKNVLKRLHTYTILIMLLCAAETGAYNNSSYKANIYGIGAGAPAQAVRTSLPSAGSLSARPATGSTMATEPVARPGVVKSPTISSYHAKARKTAMQRQTSSQYSSASTTYPVYTGASRQTLHSYGGSSQGGAGSYSTGGRNTSSVSTTAGAAGIQVFTMPAQKRNSTAGATYSMESDDTQYASTESDNTAGIGKLFAPPTGGGEGGDEDEPWGGYDRDLWNTFRDAWLSGEGEDGLNYYSEQKLYELWLEYIAAHPGQMPGEANLGYTWDELIAYLRQNTANGTGYSMLPVGDGLWAMIAMVLAYLLSRIKKVRNFKIGE